MRSNARLANEAATSKKQDFYSVLLHCILAPKKHWKQMRLYASRHSILKHGKTLFKPLSKKERGVLKKLFFCKSVVLCDSSAAWCKWEESARRQRKKHKKNTTRENERENDFTATFSTKNDVIEKHGPCCMCCIEKANHVLSLLTVTFYALLKQLNFKN